MRPLQSLRSLLGRGGAWKTGRWVGFLLAKDEWGKDHGEAFQARVAAKAPRWEGQALFRNIEDTHVAGAELLWEP